MGTRDEGRRNEIHDFYFQITNNLAYPSFAFRTDYPSNIQIFNKNRIRILDSSINIDNWSILLVESIKYGKLLEQNTNELQSEKGTRIPLSSITIIYYSPGNDNFAVLDHFIFKFVEGSNYSPMTIIPIVVCDEGCFGCDENFVERATEQKECYFCKTGYYKYENSQYIQLIAITDYPIGGTIGTNIYEARIINNINSSLSTNGS